MIERDDLSALPKAQRERYERQYQSAEQAINVGQLIKKLKEYPQDLPVVVDYDFIKDFRIRDDYFLGDPASPYGCAECKVLIIE